MAGSTFSDYMITLPQDRHSGMDGLSLPSMALDTLFPENMTNLRQSDKAKPNRKAKKNKTKAGEASAIRLAETMICPIGAKPF